MPGPCCYRRPRRRVSPSIGGPGTATPFGSPHRRDCTLFTGPGPAPPTDRPQRTVPPSATGILAVRSATGRDPSAIDRPTSGSPARLGRRIGLWRTGGVSRRLLLGAAGRIGKTRPPARTPPSGHPPGASSFPIGWIWWNLAITATLNA